MKRLRSGFCFLFLLCLILTGCQSTSQSVSEPRLSDKGRITLSVLENHLAGPDPCEGFNRSMFAVTNFLMDYVADPLGRVYSSILPRPFIEHLNNACVNLEFPARAISCLIRAEWKGAGHETARFFINLTVGVIGLFDPAENFWQIHSTDSDFGQAFAAWGIDPGATFILPASSAINVRDTVGLLFDMVFDIKTYIPYSGWATTLNRMVIAHRAYQQVVAGSNDKYKNYRELALINRELKLRMWRYHALNQRDKLIEEGKLPLPLAPSPEISKPSWMQGNWLELKDFGPGTPITDSLRVTLFKAQNDDDYWYLRLSIFNDDFTKRRHDRQLEIAPDRPELNYAFWKMPEPGKDKDGNDLPPLPEKLAVLLPGIGGTADAAAPTAYAELLNRNGYAVLVIDSTFTWQFVTSSAGCRLPGFLPSDAAAVRNVIKAALDDLKKDEMIKNPEIVLTGYSFGGMHLLKIAELEEKDPILNVKKYLAVNPPASLKYAVEQADSLADSMRGKKPDEVIDQTIGTVGRIMAQISKPKQPFTPEMTDDIKQNYRIQADPEISKFLAGLYFRSSMRSMLFAAHRDRGLIPLKNVPVNFTKNKLYLLLDNITFKEYAEKYLISEYPGVKIETLYKKSDLRSLSAVLKNNPKVRILHSVNDFLLSEEDKKYLDSTLGKRITWTSRGGHLGHLYYQCVQNKIINLLK